MTTDPHPKLIPLLMKYGVSHDDFVRKGRPPKGTGEALVGVRSAIITELHSQGTTWSEMMEVTGLGLGSIQRLTKAMWNQESRKRVREIGIRTGKSWKGKSRPGQLERQWGAGDFDRPSTRAKYSQSRVQYIKEHPEFNYPRGNSEWVPSLKGGTQRIKVRSSFEKHAIRILDGRDDVVSYIFEAVLELANGRHILPDFIVTHQNGTRTLIEVKPLYVLDAKDQRNAKDLARLDVAKQEAFSRGWAFAIWTEKELGC